MIKNMSKIILERSVNLAAILCVFFMKTYSTSRRVKPKTQSTPVSKTGQNHTHVIGLRYLKFLPDQGGFETKFPSNRIIQCCHQ